MERTRDQKNRSFTKDTEEERQYEKRGVEVKSVSFSSSHLISFPHLFPSLSLFSVVSQVLSVSVLTLLSFTSKRDWN